MPHWSEGKVINVVLVAHAQMGHAVAQVVIVAMVSAQYIQQLMSTKISCSTGPTYCGKGCISNCGAVAECGQYADAVDKDCPLNTCCSQHGFVSPGHASTFGETEAHSTNHSVAQHWTSVELGISDSSTN